MSVFLEFVAKDHVFTLGGVCTFEQPGQKARITFAFIEKFLFRRKLRVNCGVISEFERSRKVYWKEHCINH